MSGWSKIKIAAKYAGVSERTMWVWLKQGLRHSKLPSGHVLISYTAIDEYLQQYQVDESAVDKIVDEVFCSHPKAGRS